MEKHWPHDLFLKPTEHNGFTSCLGLFAPNSFSRLIGRDAIGCCLPPHAARRSSKVKQRSLSVTQRPVTSPLDAKWTNRVSVQRVKVFSCIWEQGPVTWPFRTRWANWWPCVEHKTEPSVGICEEAFVLWQRSLGRIEVRYGETSSEPGAGRENESDRREHSVSLLTSDWTSGSRPRCQNSAHDCDFTSASKQRSQQIEMWFYLWKHKSSGVKAPNGDYSHRWSGCSSKSWSCDTESTAAPWKWSS